MPDGDRFERALRGPWRFPYRIAAGGASPQIVADKLGSSCLGLLDAESIVCARQTLAALDAALVQSSMPLFYGEAQSSAFQRLTRGLDTIASEHHFEDFAQGCGRAASRCFFQLEQSYHHVGDDQLEKMFAQEILQEVVGRNFFPIVRDRLAENTGRDAVAQRVWESQVMRSLEEKIQPFTEALFASDAQRRAPRRARPTPAPAFDWNRLNQPLHVLGA